MNKPRVLVMAEAANPELVSVPLVGWSLANALRSVADVHIVTQVRNRDAFLRAGLKEGTDFTSVDTEKVAAPLWRFSKLFGPGAWTAKQALSAIPDAYFERIVWQRFGASITAGEWDIVHRVTPLTPTKPSYVARQCAKVGVPFVLGPLNGGVPWPKGFDKERRREGEWLSYVRSAYKLLPMRGATLTAASAIMVGSKFTMGEIPQVHSAKTIYLPENGIDVARFHLQAAPAADDGPLRACFVGRMVPYKGADMLIEAAAPLLKAGKLTLTLIGDGPMLPELKQSVASLGLDGTVEFSGWLEHAQVQQVMASCDLLTFPSIREFGGGVVLEAMALGLPPLVVDYAGPGELVQPEWGYTIPIGPRADIIRDLRDALEQLIIEPQELLQKGMAARARVEETFTWSQKAMQIAQVYDWVRAPVGPAPTLID
ncbi:MAG TPA: glycosyl transferase family 1 [Sulfitobacter sp.]|jgi:glycosyltransferase involved in cell wall biosynthesis|uniref:glycosyltransferase family 4 protein n=1 Tax=Sulfitobacter dubius TaxID=218673 RepID=UPI000E90927E|nr:glycosyl transferase family 1 [Sulfitobacter sp.]